MLFIMIYFWSVTDVYRPQRKPETCLATIEAVYYFFKEYDQHILKRFENASTVPYLCKKKSSPNFTLSNKRSGQKLF